PPGVLDAGARRHGGRAPARPARGAAMTVRDHYDVAVIGAGPAGLAAATLTACAGLSTVLFDEQATPGGQIYRAITTTPLRRRDILGEAYWDGAALVD